MEVEEKKENESLNADKTTVKEVPILAIKGFLWGQLI